MLLLNAFAPNMLARFPSAAHFEEISVDEAKAALEGNLESAVGHADTATLFEQTLGLPIEKPEPTNRKTITLQKGDTAIIGAYRGPRLPAGATTLPDGATIQWLRVSIS